ncbi:adenylyltransferase/cytidyltransferase family protein [Candidatus Woesebacteria bacterium]|nr:adenylyltransferase/cytidyltransferase family protein [Candidatus Woesebacteria bacterium]
MKTCVWEYDNIQTLTQSIPHDAKTVLVGGCFDLLHYGHLTFLQNAAIQGDFLIVALEPDAFITKYKYREPIHTQQERAEILCSLRLVKAVVNLPLFSSNQEYESLVEVLSPAVIAVTEGDPLLAEKRKQAQSIGGRVVAVSSLLPKYSTSRIIELLS